MFALSQYEAVRLFAERAVLSQPTFALTDGNAPAVAQVCQRLDGIPLAIELAAARMKALPVETIAERLNDRFRLLTGGSRTALPRHQTLRALIDWSYDFLSEPERAVLRRLSVFAGGCTLEAAEAVCAGEGIEEWEVLDLLTRLVEKSLVTYEEQEGRARYRLLETVRQYAWERLLQAGEEAVVRGRHRDFFVRWVEKRPWGGSALDPWRLHEPEEDNFRAALAWSRERGEAQEGLRLGAGLWSFWWGRGCMSEMQEQMSAMLALPQASEHTPVRAAALMATAHLALAQGQYEAARALYGESLAIAREMDLKSRVACCLEGLGMAATEQGDYAAARSFLEEGLAMFRELDGKAGIASSLHNLAYAEWCQGDDEAAAAHWEQALALARERRSRFWIPQILQWLGRVAQRQGDRRSASALFRESLVEYRGVGDDAGSAANSSGVSVATGLQALAAMAADEGDPQRAARLLGAAQSLHDASAGRRERVETEVEAERAALAEQERVTAFARAALGDHAFTAAWAEGRALSLEAAIACALENPDPEVLPSRGSVP